MENSNKDRSYRSYPLLFGRQSGGPFNMLNILDSNRVSEYLRLICQLKDNYEVLKKDIVKSTEVLVKNQICDNRRNILINFKRDIYNGRNIKKKYREIIENVDGLSKKTQLYIEQEKALEICLQEFKIIFYKELFRTIKELHSLSSHHFIKNGILMSSSSLMLDVENSTFDFEIINAKNRSLITSALNYITRGFTKTSSFSSFTPTFCLRLAQDNYQPVEYINQNSYFQLSNIILYYLNRLLFQSDNYRNELIIVCTPNVVSRISDEQNLHYFVNDDNDETFKRIKDTPVINYISELLSSTTFKYSELVNHLVEKTENSIYEVKKYVEYLITHRFLVFQLPFSYGCPDRLMNLSAFLSENLTVSDVLIKDVAELLKLIMKNVELLNSNSNIIVRKKIIQETYERIKYIFFHSADKKRIMQKVTKETVFFEDTFVNTDLIVRYSQYTEVTKSLQGVFYNLNKLPYKKTMKLFIAKKMLPQERMPILQFYDNVYLRFSPQFPMDNESFKNYNDILGKITAYFKDNSTKHRIDLKSLLNTDDCAISDVVKFGAYIQVNDNNWSEIYLNAFSNGNGVNCSRFYNHLPHKYSVVAKEYMKTQYFGELVANVKDASLNNVNVHPNLCDNFIDICGNLESDKDCTKISLSDIFVHHCKKEGLVLKDKEGIVIRPMHFSVEGLNRKSKFSQFFDLFNTVDLSGYTFFIKRIDDYFYETYSHKDFIFIPQVDVGGNIVLKRRTWVVKKTKILETIKYENDYAQQYVGLYLLFKRYNIPCNVFIKTADKKPIYFNINSPVYLLVLVNILKTAGDHIEFEEMAPNPKEGSQSRVREFILNV